MKDGFLKVAAASPDLRVTDCKYNVKNMISLAELANSDGVKLIVFPELSITAYTCGDLFLNRVLITGAHNALREYLSATEAYDIISVVGLPLHSGGKLYNCAAVCHKGKVLGIVPKDKLSSEETRCFAVGGALDDLELYGISVPFGTDLQFNCRSGVEFSLGVKIGDRGISEVSGATVIAVPTASAEFIGSDEYRRTMLKSSSASNVAGYVYANAGYGESTTDHVYAAHDIICENGNLLSESLPFEIDMGTENEGRIIISELDVGMLSSERVKTCTALSENVRVIPFRLEEVNTVLTRKYPFMPFVPDEKDELERRTEMILKIQAAGLRRRMEAAYAKKCIIGISGGLDSTLALLVAVKACDDAGRPRTDIIGITMPCFGTTNRTKGNAELLCNELGIEFRTIMIGDSVRSHFNDISHDIDDHNVVYENAQARERTQVLMDIANAENGIVVGTGDMSELALGWATYNGDHMSMYGVNASVTKTLVRAVTDHCAKKALADGQKALHDVLKDILDTPVSPELLPADGEKINQKTEDLVGPYEIHDFYLYYMLRYGFSPKKLFRIIRHAQGGVYSADVHLKWLEVFVKRFFSQQYKRSCLPDGPAVGSVGLSPRGGLQMPSDASSALWRAEIEEIKSNLK